MPKHYNVLVVGAGPAGSSAAQAAGREGVSVLMIDSKQQRGMPVQCAECVPKVIYKFLKPLPGAIVQKLDGMLTYINGKLASNLRAPGYILNRAVFDQQLVTEAEEAGTEVWFKARAAAKEGHRVFIQKSDGAEEITCDYIIGADGPRSTVGKWMNSVNQNYMLGLQYTFPLTEARMATEFYFNPEYTGGYAWLFPRGEYANVGVGVTFTHHQALQSLTADLIARLFNENILKDGRELRRTGGLIPVGGPLPVTVRENMLLAGDAAGHTHPVTGGGIMNAMVCGRIAGNLAAAAILEKNPDKINEYPSQWQAVLGRNLREAADQRTRLDQEWSSDPERFAALIKDCWLAFGPVRVNH